MKRLRLDVPRWHIYQHREARGLDGVDKNDSKRMQFEDELFDRLYSGEIEVLAEEKQDPKLGAFAKKVHETCENLPSFQRLAKQVKGDAAMAGLAVEQLMVDLTPLFQDEVKNTQGDDLPPELPPDAAKKVMDKMRQTVNKATQKAGKVIEEVAEASEALDAIEFGGYQPGDQTADHTRQHGERVRRLANKLQTNATMKHFMELVGRFRRIAANKAKQKVRHGVDEITDIVQGDDLARLLPTETARLMNPTRKLAFFRDFQERSLLQYSLNGVEPKGKGPMVVCLDKSMSMDGLPDEWATAVALALGDLAIRDGRVFAMISFDTVILYEAIVKKGEKLPEKVLDIDCRGGTDIDVAFARALQIIVENPGQLAKADIVMITDGGSHQGRTKELRELAKKHGVQSFGVAIGVNAECLKPWCDNVETVTDISRIDDKLATKLFAN